MDLVILCMGVVLVCGIGIAMLCAASREIEEQFSVPASLLMILCDIVLAGVLWQRGDVPVLFILKYLTLVTVLCVCAWTDYRKYQILNKILFVAFLMCIVWLAIGFWIDQENFTYGIVSAVIAAGMLGLASLLCKLVSQKGIGFGDVKLLIVFGGYAGVDLAMGIIIYTFLIMFALCVVLLLLRKVNRQSMVPFAPFLFAGATIYVFMAGV